MYFSAVKLAANTLTSKSCLADGGSLPCFHLSELITKASEPPGSISIQRTMLAG